MSTVIVYAYWLGLAVFAVWVAVLTVRERRNERSRMDADRARIRSDEEFVRNLFARIGK